MRTSFTRLSILTLFLTLLAGCMVRPQPTAEELEMRQRFMQGLMNRMNNNQNTVANKNTDSPAQTQTTSEQELAKQLDLLPKLTTGIVVVKKKDGFNVNGRGYVDPEGQIVKYGASAKTGDITYMLQLSEDTYAIKTMRVGSDPILVATAQMTSSGWNVTTVTGKKMLGAAIIPLSRGFMVGRPTAGFLYMPGKGITNVSVLDGFRIAPFQNGDIVGTGYILLEREELDKSNQLGGLFSAVTSLGSTMGINKKEDYMLLNMDTGRQIFINVSMEGKNEKEYSNCRKKGAMINACKNVEFFESLYDKYGMPNAGHYFWRISWQNSNSGPLLIITENSMRETTVENLNTGKKAVLFNRLLGINYVIVSEKPDGKISATAKLGLDTQTIEDIEQTLNSSAVTVTAK